MPSMPEGWNDDWEKRFQAAFAADPRYRNWYQGFMQRFGEVPNLNAPEYNYRLAYMRGIAPTPDEYDSGFPHWPSSLDDGTMLKAPDHPTAWKEHFMRRFTVNPDELSARFGMPEQQLKGLLDD